MLEQEIIKESFDKTLSIELKAIELLKSSFSQEFIDSVHFLSKIKGRIIITGIGKSALIGKKIVATLNSTGSPSIFMHAADALHGDLGMIQKEDAVICISKSGNTPEVKALIPLIKLKGNTLISIVNNDTSYLAVQSDFTILTKVEEEACPHNLAPTASTTSQLVIGDMIAVALLKLNNFSNNDFANNHPGGTLGKKLYLKVSDFSLNDFAPIVDTTDSVIKVIQEISKGRVGATAVVEEQKIIGIITDGDLRRLIESNQTDFKNILAKEIMNSNPKMIDANTMATEALSILQKNNISQLIVMKNDAYFGVLHLHELIREGII